MADTSTPAQPKAATATKTSDDTAAKDAANSSEPSLHIRIASPFKVFFDDKARSLSGSNATGPFDILPHHHNFISMLGECELAIKTCRGTVKVRISGGIMHVKSDQIVIFLNV